MNRAIFLTSGGLILLTLGISYGHQSEDPAAGQTVFESYCAACHHADSVKRKNGPGLKGLFKETKLVNNQKVDESTVLDFINQGCPENGMPPFAKRLTDQEKADLIAYLKTL